MKIVFLVLMSFSLNLMAHEHKSTRTDDIKNWDDVYPERGYTLSEDLVKRNCLSIYNKQINLFLKKNPDVKDANLLRENELIFVQNCANDSKDSVAFIRHFGKKKNKERNHYFFEFIIGASFLGKENNDTPKKGFSTGVKFGHVWNLKRNHSVGSSFGYLFNNSRTSNSTDLGRYSVKSHLGTLDTYYSYSLTKKFKLGVIGTGIFGKDISFKEDNVSDTFGLYGGLLGIYKVSRKVDFTLTTQQRLDQSRSNILMNLGLRFKF